MGLQSIPHTYPEGFGRLELLDGGMAFHYYANSPVRGFSTRYKKRAMRLLPHRGRFARLTCFVHQSDAAFAVVVLLLLPSAAQLADAAGSPADYSTKEAIAFLALASNTEDATYVAALMIVRGSGCLSDALAAR